MPRKNRVVRTHLADHGALDGRFHIQRHADFNRACDRFAVIILHVVCGRLLLRAAVHRARHADRFGNGVERAVRAPIDRIEPPADVQVLKTVGRYIDARLDGIRLLAAGLRAPSVFLGNILYMSRLLRLHNPRAHLKADTFVAGALVRLLDQRNIAFAAVQRVFPVGLICALKPRQRDVYAHELIGAARRILPRQRAAAQRQRRHENPYNRPNPAFHRHPPPDSRRISKDRPARTPDNSRCG